MIKKKSVIYLDNAAATPIDEEVYGEYLKYFKDYYYNPSAIYKNSLMIKDLIEESRNQIANILGSKSSEIIFTSGTSESNNLAIKGVMESYKNSNLITLKIEHDSILKPALNYRYKICKVKKDGLIDLENLKDLIDSKTVLVSIAYSNSEIGVIQPINKIQALIKAERQKRIKTSNNRPIYFHSDSSSASNSLALKVNKLGLDLMSLGASKIYGPREIGLLYIQNGIHLKPLIEGGGQEHNRRSGTENLPAIMAFSKALKLAQIKYLKSEKIRLTELKKHLLINLENINPDIRINGSVQNSLPAIINITIPGVDNEWLIMKLDQNNILLSSGSACNESKEQLSHVLEAIGLSEKSITNSIRISLGRNTTKQDIDHFIKVLSSLL